MSLARVDYVPALCTHRPSLLPIEWLSEASGGGVCREANFGETGQTWSFRGSKSRNKVSVGEPAEGSLESGAGVAVKTAICLAKECDESLGMPDGIIGPSQRIRPLHTCSRKRVSNTITITTLTCNYNKYYF